MIVFLVLPSYLLDLFLQQSNDALWFFSGMNCALYDVFQIPPLQNFLSAMSRMHTYHVMWLVEYIESLLLEDFNVAQETTHLGP